VSWDTPIQTVWPAALALVVWGWALRKVWRDIRLPHGWWWIAVLALFVRLLWVPALEMHQFDGHEAEYWDLFRGVREPTRGGTVMVPAMQWFWWLSGVVLPASHALVVVISALVGVVSIGFAAGALGLLVGPQVGWATAILLALHPSHAAWSSSAYNIIFPHLFGCMALFAAAVSARRSSPPGGWAWVAAASLALSVALRLDSGTMGLAVLGLVLSVRPSGMGVGERFRQWFPAGMGSVFMAGLCAWPMVWPGALPGSGERALSFETNINFFDVYHPFDGVVGWVLLGVAAAIGLRRHRRVVLPLFALVLAHHLIMATFDDFGERHIVVVLPALVGLFSIGWTTIGRGGWLAVAVMAGVQADDLQDLRQRYYGSEATYVSLLDTPRWGNLERNQWKPSLPGECGWVAEDDRVARNPPISHFNILDPVEEQAHRSTDGCLLWCVDVQDWRWSSRGVRDRALRLAHLFPLRPAFVVTDQNTGYGCLVMEVGQRDHPMSETPNGYDKAASHGNHPIP
jgi:hypothetical protein